MLEVTYRLKLGQDEFELKATVKDEKEFFETMSFYSSLPKVAPNGANDLRLVFRTTTKGHKYYSLVSDSEKMEFKLGQNLDANGGGLFPKGWAPVYQGEDQDDQQAPPPPAARPPPAAAPRPALPATPKATAMPTIPTLAQPQMAVPAQVVTAPTPVAAAPVTAPVPAAVQNPQVTAVANDVLARFNIKR